MEIKYKLWIEKDGKVVFGKGRDEILTSIQETRSLNAAAKKLKMSYRAAWGRLKASEERADMKLVEVDSTEKGMHLTPQAKAIMDRFEKLEKDVKSLLMKANLDFHQLLEKKKK
jgi:molybdate transport system regulatory protein